MNKLMKYIIKLINNLLLMACISTLHTSAAFATDTELDDLTGNKHKVSEYIGNGKWTIINIWGPKCPPCRDEMPDLVQFHDTHKDNKAIVVGIAIDFPSYGYANKKQVAAFAEDFMIDFPILLSDSTITSKLGIGELEGLPTTILYTPEGKLAAMQVGAVSKELLENYIKKYESR